MCTCEVGSPPIMLLSYFHGGLSNMKVVWIIEICLQIDNNSHHRIIDPASRIIDFNINVKINDPIWGSTCWATEDECGYHLKLASEWYPHESRVDSAQAPNPHTSIHHHLPSSSEAWVRRWWWEVGIRVSALIWRVWGSLDPSLELMFISPSIPLPKAEKGLEVIWTLTP